MFNLHSQLEKDCAFIKDLNLCRVLLLNNAVFPWVVVVPKRDFISEIFELNEDDQKILSLEISFIAKKMKEFFKADKMNVAALGNQVAQLHIHIIARFKNDNAWPKPVWGNGARPYSETEKDELIQKLKKTFNEA